MANLIKGDDLTNTQKRQVLTAYVHRWTFENQEQTYRGQCPACAQRSGPQDEQSMREWHEYHKPLQTDAEWLSERAFYFIADGSRLSAKHDHCEPAYMAA